MPSFTRSFLTLFFLGILVPVFEGAPISRRENEEILPRISYDHDSSIHPREPSTQGNSQSLGRRSLHPADVNVNTGMVPRSLHAQVPLNAELEPRTLHRRHLVAQVPLNEDIEPRQLSRRHLVAQVPLNAEIEPRRLSRRHLVAQVPLNAEIEPRSLHRRSLFAQVPLNAEIEPRDEDDDDLVRRGVDDADEDGEPAHHELKLPHHKTARVFTRADEDSEPSLFRRFVIPFTIRPLRALTWSPVVFPFVSVPPSYTFSAPGFAAHHVEHAGGAVRNQIDPSVHKKTEDDIDRPSSFRSGGDPSLVLQPRKGLTTRSLSGSKMKSWSMSVSSHSEETVTDGHRKGNAQELITVHSAHSPSAAEAKKNGGKLVESGEAFLITAKTPKEGTGSKASDKPEITIEHAVLGPKKKSKKPEDKDADADAHPNKSASPSGAGAEKEGKDDSDDDDLDLRWFDSL